MSYLVTQMLLCLLLAALLGFLIGWALRAMMCQKKIAELEELIGEPLPGTMNEVCDPGPAPIGVYARQRFPARPAKPDA